MAIIQIYSHPETRVFRSSICSKAAFFSLFSFLLLLLPPFFIAFAGRTFWLKEDFYRDSPQARFAYKAIVVLESDNSNGGGGGSVDQSDYRIFSTFDNFNLLHGEKFIAASIDVLPSQSSPSPSSSSSNVKISLFPGANFHVGSVTALIFFHYDLLTYTRLSMEGMAHFQKQSSSAGSRYSSLWVDGELRFKQGLF